MATRVESRTVNFYTSRTGLSTVAYRLINSDGTTNVARTTTGVTEVVATSGIYGAAVTIDNTFIGRIVWDTGGTTPVYAPEDIQAISTTTQTVVLPTVTSGCPMKIVQDSTSLWTFTVYKSDGTVKNLSSFTSAKISLRDASGTLKISLATMTITDATNGICTYQPVAGDVDTNGTFTGNITFNTGTYLDIVEGITVVIDKRVK